MSDKPADSKTSSTSSGRAAQDPPVGRASERVGSASASSDEGSFEDFFGEPGEAQERVILDRSIIVEREGSTVLTDNPQPGDLPQGVAQRKAARQDVEDQERRRSQDQSSAR